MKSKNIPLSEQLQNPIEKCKTRGKTDIPNTQIKDEKRYHLIIVILVVAEVNNKTDSNNKTMRLHDFNIPVTFYDFSIGHDDFSSISGILPTSPYYVVSPLGSWLAVSDDTMTDSVSNWFRSTDTNIKVDGGILLSYVATITTSEVFRYIKYIFCYPGNVNT